MDPRDPQNWMTPTMRRLQAELDGVGKIADDAIARAEGVRVVERRLSDEEIQLLTEAAEQPSAPEALRQLRERVESGAYSWRDIAEGRAFSDPAVVQAYTEAGAQVDGTVVRQIVAELQEGATPDEITAAHAPRSRDEDDGDGGFGVFENRFT